MTTRPLILDDHTGIELLLSADGLFRGLGGVPLRNGGFVTREPGIPDWWQRNLAVFNRAEPYMRGTRRLLPNCAGVVWHSEAGRCPGALRVPAEAPALRHIRATFSREKTGRLAGVCSSPCFRVSSEAGGASPRTTGCGHAS